MTADDMLAKVQAMAKSVKDKPWQHEMAFNFSLRVHNRLVDMGREDIALLVQCEMEMSYPEFPIDFGR